MRIVALAVWLAASLAAQITAPLLGWLPEGTGIRPMNGLPGAATLGPALNAGHKLVNSAVSPSQNYILAADAASGQVLLLVPGGSTTAVDVPSRPDQIVVSPRGSSAALIYSAAARIQVLSGLPSAPAARTIDASFLSITPVAIAVSDDGQRVAMASPGGVYEWNAGAAAQQIYGASDASALAFLAGSSNLLIATSTQLLSVGDSASAVLYQNASTAQNSFAPAGVASSFDNSKIVLADRSGTIYSIDAATRTPSILDCQCRPSGVFGLGGSVFRLNSPATGAVKVFDAVAGAVLAIPGDPVKTRRAVVAATVRPADTLPTLAITISPAAPGYLQQPALTITASSAYPSDLVGNVGLAFTPSVAGNDYTVQFSNGLTAVNFTIPAGSTQANFSGAPSVTVSTGTVAGTIALSANITAPVLALGAATQSITTSPAVPVITSVKFAQTPGGVTVTVTGYSPTDDMFSGSFTFALTSNATITANDLSVGLSPQFASWYGSANSYPTGSEFTLAVPFAITGNPADMTGVSVTLINSRGASNPVSSQ